MYNLKFKITNLECPACVILSNDALREIPGVIDSQVDLKSGLAEIESERKISLEEIKVALELIDKKAVAL